MNADQLAAALLVVLFGGIALYLRHVVNQLGGGRRRFR